MNISLSGITLLNVETKQEVCNCDVHGGDRITQINATLPNGKPVVIMQDWRGLHVAIGARNAIGQFSYTQPVAKEQVQQILSEAMK